MPNGLRAVGSASIRLKVYPTGEFSATRVRETDSLGLESFAPAYASAEARLGKGCQVPGRPTASFVASLIPPLGSSNVPNSHKDRESRGRRGMTAYNKRLIVNSAILLERKYGKKHIGFLTLTLPTECANGDARAYAECKRQMLQWLSRRLSESALPKLVVGCTELQATRYENSGDFALHEHWLFVARKPGRSWAVRAKVLQSQWISILANTYGVVIDESRSKAAVNLQRVKSSAAAYLGKYMSKSESVVERAIASGHERCLPASWVTRTLEMLSMFRHSIVSLSGEKAASMMDILRKFRGQLTRWNKDLSCVLSNGEVGWIAFIGYLNPGGRKLLDLIRTGQSPGFQL